MRKHSKQSRGRQRTRAVSCRWILTVFLVFGLMMGSNTLTVMSTATPVRISTVEQSTVIAQIQVQDDRIPGENFPSRGLPERPSGEPSSQDFLAQFFNFRDINSWGYRLLFTVIATLVLIGVLSLLKRLSHRIRVKIHRLRENQRLSFKVQQLQILNSDSAAQGLLLTTRLARLSLSLLAIAAYLAVLPNFFPQTAALGRTLQSYGMGILRNVAIAIVSYIPNMIAIALTTVTTYYILKLLKVVFDAFDRGQIVVPGFYREWIQPTHKLLQFLICAIALAFILPYLPGFGSPAFQGLSILIGALITLGGASTVSNLIGGFITIYTRAFQIGDRIQIGEFVGIVMEKTILSTRIRTSTNEIVTIPNSSLMTSHIVNYTATLRDIQEPLILHTKISLGYDIAWRKVHQVLTTAALATEHVLNEPAPVVRQLSLDDFYITYELRAFTHEIDSVNVIYSELNQNILDQCNENDIEILSPHYSALRDGNRLTLPESYLPQDYHSPGFRIHTQDKPSKYG